MKYFLYSADLFGNAPFEYISQTFLNLAFDAAQIALFSDFSPFEKFQQIVLPYPLQLQALTFNFNVTASFFSRQT